MDLILGFACGIATSMLIKKLEALHNKKLNAGDEEICNDCCYKKTVLETLEDVQSQ
ncbi:MAG: hypothetical protein UIM53_00335 [Acutalibacteraceae bacterium]|nr:hypothetical protein [Acutalibacteraceae bacterium]